jgi:hypothetical protein
MGPASPSDITAAVRAMGRLTVAASDVKPSADVSLKLADLDSRSIAGGSQTAQFAGPLGVKLDFTTHKHYPIFVFPKM